MLLSENIKKMREDHNLTQQQLADRLYVSRQTVCRWENGSRCPDLITAKKLATELGVSVDELISDEEINNSTVRFSFLRFERFSKRKHLQEQQTRILDFIQIVSGIFLGISILFRVQLDREVPVWCTVLGFALVGTAFVIRIIISRKIDKLQ